MSDNRTVQQVDYAVEVDLDAKKIKIRIDNQEDMVITMTTTSAKGLRDRLNRAIAALGDA